MKLDPLYSENLIIAIAISSSWRWFVGNYQYWLLDYEAYTRSFLLYDSGPNRVSKFDSAGIRQDFMIVTKENGPDFLAAMGEYEVSLDELQEYFLSHFPKSRPSWGEVCELFPTLLIDFDRCHVSSMYPELAYCSVAPYVSPGWSCSEYYWFLDKIPMDQRYWIIDGKDCDELISDYADVRMYLP